MKLMMARAGERSARERVPYAEARALGYQLRQRRVRLGLSQRELSKLLRTSFVSVHNHETGVGSRSAFRRHEELLLRLEREAPPEVRGRPLPRIPRPPPPGSKYQRPSSRLRIVEERVDWNPPKPPGYPLRFAVPLAVSGAALLWHCEPLGARLTEVQCAANRRRARKPRGEVAKLLARRAPVTAARLEGLEPCLTCLGVRERARRTGVGPIAFQPRERST